jgi:hypothetical protein
MKLRATVRTLDARFHSGHDVEIPRGEAWQYRARKISVEGFQVKDKWFPPSVILMIERVD